VQPALAGQLQAAQHPADVIEVAGHDDAGDEQIAAVLRFVEDGPVLPNVSPAANWDDLQTGKRPMAWS
jgi:hypothetical protein